MIIRKPEEGGDVRPGEEASLEEARMTYFWTWFNVLTMGLVDVAKADAVHHDEEEMRSEEANLELNIRTLESALACLRKMREAAYAFVKEDAKSGWSLREKETWQKETNQTVVELADIGLYFHCYPHCSINSLHLHIVDESEVGPSYEACRFKNLSMDIVLTALEKEIKEYQGVKNMKSAKRLLAK